MDRRDFLSVVASCPLLSSLPVVDVTDDSKKDVVAIKAHYTDYLEEISYRYDDRTQSVDLFENKSHDEWFSEVSEAVRKFDCSVPALVVISDADLRAVTAKPDYSHSVFNSGEYQIQVHGGTENVDAEFYVEYYTGIEDEIKSFAADSYIEIQAKLDRRNVIF